MKVYYKTEPWEKFGTKKILFSQGSFGKVYQTSKGFALKSIRANDYTQGILQEVIRELVIIRSINHPNIVKILALTNCYNDMMYYMDKALCTLHDYIYRYSCLTDVTDYKPLWFMYQLANAIDYCHYNKIIHRDLKPQNLLLYSNGRLCLADFGLSKYTTGTGLSHSGNVTSRWWRAPEVLLGAEYYDQSIDIWSMGVIFATLLSGENPLKGSTDDEQLELIKKLIGSSATELSQETGSLSTLKLQPLEYELVSKMLAWDVRINSADILNHSLFNTVRDQVKKEYPLEKIPEYILPKESIEPNVRVILFRWIYEVGIGDYNCSNETVIFAYTIFDHFADSQSLMIDEVQGYSIMALVIAIKMVESVDIDLDFASRLTGNTYTKYVLLKYERYILKALDYYIPPEPYTRLLKEYSLAYDKNVQKIFIKAYFNYSWVTTWQPQQFVKLLCDYILGVSSEYDTELFDNYFSQLEELPLEK